VPGTPGAAVLIGSKQGCYEYVSRLRWGLWYERVRASGFTGQGSGIIGNSSGFIGQGLRVLGFGIIEVQGSRSRDSDFFIFRV